jgi:uncharacterized protein
MPEFNGYPAGTPSWVDIGTPDVEAAKAFYGQLFGWEFVDQGPNAGGYHMCNLRGKPVAGLGPAQDPGPPHWTTYVAVDDTDTAVKAVESAGGTVLATMDIPEAGRMAVCTDSTGVAFSVWQAGQHGGVAIANEAGAFSWSELNTRDTAKAIPFYESVFGWKAETMTEPMPYTQLMLDGKSIAGMMDVTGRVPDEVPAHWLVYFGTDNCDGAVETTEKAGGALRVGPVDIPDMGRFAVLNDPQGAVFAVFQM